MSLTWLGLAFLLLTGCSGEDGPPVVVPERSLFWEPASVCQPSNDSSDTLFVTNGGTQAFTWDPTHSPAGSTNLDVTVSVPAGQTVGILWSWTPPDTGNVRDSLVVNTTDPTLPRVSIPFRKVSAGYNDTEPPPAPALILPLDDVTFVVGDTLLLEWTRVSDCSGIKTYQFQIASNPQFSNPYSVTVGVTAVEIIVEPLDVGEGYWRVRVQDKANLVGPWSETRSWTILSSAPAARY